MESINWTNEIFFTGTMPNLKYRLGVNYLKAIRADESKNGHLLDQLIQLIQPINLLHMFLFWTDVTLRGISQVFLCDHPITGITYSKILFFIYSLPIYIFL